MSSELLPKLSLKNHLRPLLTPKYLGSRVSDLTALAGLLDVSLPRLQCLAKSADDYYRLHQKIEKSDGSVRYIYSVYEPLKGILKKINNRVFKHCDYPEYLTGSLPGWSYSENAALHAGKGTVITIDATNFFPSISRILVEKIWRDFFCFDRSVASLLAELCCYKGFLAQGSPTSSYLSNLAFWDVEPLIVQEFRSRGYVYSRYVDDICVSHRRKLKSEEKTWAILAAKKIFLSKGLKVKSRKTKVMDRNRRQEVNKRTVNAGRVCASRSLKDELRARLHRFSESLALDSTPETPHNKQYESLKGKINHFKQFNQTGADKLLDRLETLYSKHRGVEK